MGRNSRFLLFVVAVLATTLACYLVRARRLANEIRVLRTELEQRHTEQPKEETTEPPVVEVSKSEPARPPVPEAVFTSNVLLHVQNLLSLSNALAAANAERDALIEQLQVSKSTRTQSSLPEAEDPSKAYVGPGVWINGDPNTSGITRIAIAGQPRGEMSVRAWGKCHPTDCEWGIVPFALFTNHRVQGKTFRRGIGIWDFEGATKCVIVTFEKNGLNIEHLSINKRGLTSSSYRSAESFTRVE